MERGLAIHARSAHRSTAYRSAPPYMVNSDSMYGTGQLPKFAADLFQCRMGEDCG